MDRKSRWITAGVAAACILSGCSGHPPVKPGIMDGRLSPCPGSPNCVSSMDSEKKRYIPPLRYSGERAKARSVLKDVLESDGGVILVEDKDNYLYAEYRSDIFGFVDDVEFYLPDDESVIHMRSASRLGYWDFGVNRKRLERVRDLFTRADLMGSEISLPE